MRDDTSELKAAIKAQLDKDEDVDLAFKTARDPGEDFMPPETRVRLDYRNHGVFIQIGVYPSDGSTQVLLQIIGPDAKPASDPYEIRLDSAAFTRMVNTINRAVAVKEKRSDDRAFRMSSYKPGDNRATRRRAQKAKQ